MDATAAVVPEPAARPAALSPQLLLVLVALLFAAKALAFSISRAEPVDFDCFHTVGRLAWSGRLQDAYGFRTLLPAILADHGGRGSFPPFTYPPPFALLIAPLGALPTGLAYVLFAGGSLLAFLWVLRRAAGGLTTGALTAALPAIIINLACGQNGLLTGALVGAALLAGAEGRGLIAGVPTGLMIVKPHLAVTLALHVLARRRWGWAIMAAAVAVGAALLSWAVFGLSAWTGFLHGAQEASRFLHARMYPLFRMVSPYATLRSAGAPEAAALLGQVVVAGLALAGTAHLAVTAPTRRAAGFAALAGVLVSPYAYDYDLTLFAMGLVFLQPDLERLASPAERATLYALAAFGALYGLAATEMMHLTHTVYDEAHPAPAPCGLAVAGAAALVWRVLRREVRRPSPPTREAFA